MIAATLFCYYCYTITFFEAPSGGLRIRSSLLGGKKKNLKRRIRAHQKAVLKFFGPAAKKNCHMALFSPIERKAMRQAIRSGIFKFLL
jgi:hypothetical protein